MAEQTIQHCWKQDMETWCGAVVPAEAVTPADAPVCVTCHRLVMHHRAEELKRVQELQGAAGEEPAPYQELKNAAEFGAVWNARTPQQREDIFRAIQGAANDGHRCIMEDHAGLKDQLRAAQLRIVELLDDSRKLTDPELNALAQRFWEAANVEAQIMISMNMADKEALIDSLAKALSYIGFSRATPPSEWKTRLLHPEDCPQCEALAEEAILQAKLMGREGAVLTEFNSVTLETVHSAHVERE